MNSFKIIAVFLVLGLAWPALAAQGKAAREKDTADAWADLGNWKRAVAHYRKALDADPGLFEARLRMSNGLFRLGEYRPALAELRRLQKSHPKSAAVFAASAVIRLKLEQGQKACTDFGRALRIDGRHPRSLFGIGQCHHLIYDRGKQDKEKTAAISGYESYLKSYPQGAHAIDSREAIQKLRYGEVGVLLADARTAIAAGKFRLAEKALREATGKRPELEEAHYLLGTTLASPVLNRFEDAVEQWSKAPHVKEARLQLGMWCYEEDELEEAVEHLEAAVALDPRYVEPYYHLGLVYSEIRAAPGRSDEAGKAAAKAQAAFQKVLSLAPKSALASRAHSKLQLLSGQVYALNEGEVIDTASEVALGRKVAEQIEKRFGLVDDARLQQRLNAILERISEHSERMPGSMPYTIRVLNLDATNALSFAGGSILIYKGLLDFVKRELDDSDDALAFVIGHEVVHVDRRHGLGMLDLAGGANKLLQGRSLNVRSLNSLMKGISRKHEFEADQIGCLFALRAGYNPAGAYRFHMKMIAAGHEVPEGMDHPTHAERAARIREYLLGLRAKARRFDMGVRNLRENDNAQAVSHFEVFLGLFPENVQARNNLGVAKFRLAMRKLVPAHAYKLSTDIDPKTRLPKIHVREGRKQFVPEVARMYEAAGLFRSVIERDPESVRARINLGAALLALEENAQAERLFEQALQRKPDSLEAQGNLAVARLVSGRTDEGIAGLEKLLAADPSFADAHYNLARVFQKAGRSEEARAHYKAYLEKDPDSGWAAEARAQLAALEKK
ncbi:MAG: tetratricopeptide repeat protein [Deltaproteobacteria bacterium]|nr:tetratricopeptide repeat protein [Deltaproteobacteria bacterium]